MRKLVWLFVLFASGRAYAEDPWASGVSKDDQTAANALFAEGNELFAQQAHARAVEKYKAAVARWDHPAIRLNLAIAEIQIDHILEAADDLEAALRFDQAPFSAEHYQQALSYRKLLRGRVGAIEVSCAQTGVSVLLDGKPWFQCPGAQTIRLLAGEHAIIAEAKDLMTISRRVVVAGGKTAREKLALVPIESVVKLVYPSPRWLPWATIGAGAAVTLGGVGVWFAGRRQMDQFESRFAAVCPPGCSPDLAANPDLADLRDGAKLKGKIGITMMIAGGAIGAAGVVWVIVNRPARVLPKVEVVPTADGATARASWRF